MFDVTDNGVITLLHTVCDEVTVKNAGVFVVAVIAVLAVEQPPFSAAT